VELEFWGRSKEKPDSIGEVVCQCRGKARGALVLVPTRRAQGGKVPVPARMPLTAEEPASKVPFCFSEPTAEDTSLLVEQPRAHCNQQRDTFSIHTDAARGKRGRELETGSSRLGQDPGDIHSGYLVRVRATTERADQDRTGLAATCGATASSRRCGVHGCLGPKPARGSSTWPACTACQDDIQ
jgi:hypothetical protein